MVQMDYAANQTPESAQSRENPNLANESTVIGRYLGLCSTCGHSNGCTLRNNSESPVLFCEEFDSSLPGTPAVNPVPIQSKDNSSDGNMGLCINCENRDGCGFQKPEGGVWNCEEYE